jgi:hypothetical protein
MYKFQNEYLKKSISLSNSCESSIYVTLQRIFVKNLKRNFGHVLPKNNRTEGKMAKSKSLLDDWEKWVSPNKEGYIPGYTGHVPFEKDMCGKTFAKTTSTLKDHTIKDTPQSVAKSEFSLPLM